MTATDATSASSANDPTDHQQAGTDDLRSGLALLVLWMVSVLGFAGLVGVTVGDPPPAVLGVGFVIWLAPGLLAAPLMLYDGWTVRGTPAANGFRFDPFWTAVVMLVIYPLGLPVYILTRMQGPYVAAMGVDPDDMSFGDEIEFGLTDLVNPTADGVPSVWPAMVVLFAWFAVLIGDGALAVAAATGGSEALFVGVGAALVARLFATPFLLLDVFVVAKTGHFSRGEAVGLAAATTLLFPVAVVGYLPYRLRATYGR